MRYLLLSIFCGLVILNSSAQERRTIALSINSSPQEVEEYIGFRINKPVDVIIKEGQTFVCKGVYINAETDTAVRGTGVSVMIMGDFILCKIKKSDVKIMPKKGDLCFFLADGLDQRKDVFIKLARFAISFKTVTDSVLFDANSSLGKWNAGRTNDLIKALADDIRYTGKEMQKQNDSQQQIIKDGDYDGKDLFTQMQKIEENDVFEFLKYAWARPTKYSGNTWSISEVFATWMTNGTPKYTGTID